MEPTIKTNFHLMSKTQQINSFEYLNPNQRTYHQEPYQKSMSTQNQKPILASNPKPNPTNQNPEKKSSQIHKNVKPWHKIKIQSQLQIQNQTPAQATHSITKTLALYEKSPSHLYVVNKLNQ